MERHYLVLCTVFLWLALGMSPLAAEGKSAEESPPAEKKGKDTSAEPFELASIPDAASAPVTVTNTVTVGGEELTYVVETGMLPLLKDDGAARASVFYIAYTRRGGAEAGERPVTFCFNGGPGSSSVWLHLGGLGPRRVVLNEDGSMPAPPFKLEDNPHSILSATDLVFIDPVATGYSRPAKDEKLEQFFGQSQDVASVGDFIRLWTTRNQRWLSPKYLCGESYGSFRAAALADHLHDRYGMYLNGVVLLSGTLDFATLSQRGGNHLGHLSFLPTYTAIAHYHGKLPPDLQKDREKALAEAHAFAGGAYALALLRGNALAEGEREEIADQLARLTGLSTELVQDSDLRVDSARFREHLLRDQDLVLGRFDGRTTGRDADRASPTPRFDPSYHAAYGPFAAGMNDYVRRELQFTNDLPYEILAGVRPWGYDAKNSHPSVTAKLGSVMSRNPHLRVLVLGGLCDLACPIDGIRYSLDHMRLDPALRENIRFEIYESGHMMYLYPPDLEKLHRDLERFFAP